jgi:tight adherence protein B
MVAIVVGGLVAVAALVELAPARRRSPRVTSLSRPEEPRGHPRRRRRPGTGLGRAGRRAAPPDVAALMTEVAARLRAGAPVQDAWARALERAGLDDAALADRGGSRSALDAELVAVRVSTGLADALGAPLAAVLDRCALGVAAAGRAEAARRVALAGPASTARLLSALPVVGVLVGTALGADPVPVLLDGGPGTGAGLAALGLLALGHRWTSILVAAARAAGADGAVE